MPIMKINIKMISEITGFSQATVSNVLNNKKGVKRSTADKILKVSKEVGYIKANKIDDIHLVMYKKTGEVLTETPLINALLEGVVSEAKLNNMSTIIHNIKVGEPDFESKLSSIVNLRNSGIILLATEMAWQDVERFIKVSNNLVVVDAWFQEGSFDTVLMSNSDSFYSTVLYLYKKGHRSIGFIDSSIEIRNFFYRKRGFLNAMQDLNLPYNEDSFIKVHPTMSGSYEDMKRYLAGKPQLPTAFCTINDIVAFGAMKALKEFEYKIPDDISIIGFDNMPFCEITSPGLTTVNILKREMGEAAVQRVLAKTENMQNYPTKMQLLTSIIERDSVKEI